MELPLRHLTVLVWVLVSTNAEDCVYKECVCSVGDINCSFKGLTQMPHTVNISGADRSLLLSYNTITEIPANSLPSNLSQLYLISNPTTTIADTAFDGSVYTLQTINLQSALFTRIPNAFGHLRALDSLTIQDVNVQDWNDDAMSIGGQTLTSLDLENVSLSSWPNWIQNCSQLIDLTITHCSILSIPDEALGKISKSLTSLDLANNNLTSIPKALSNLSALTYLNLEHNNIIDITWFPQRSPLTALFLNNNKISNSSLLSEIISQIESSLSYIEINYNQLTAIPNFSFLTKIINLDFSNNKISDPNSGSVIPTTFSIQLGDNFLPAIPRFVSKLAHANILNFPYNVITSFVATDLTPSATSLDLGHNLITKLTDNSFPNNSQLASLYLNNNPIVAISSMAFTKLSLLTALDISYSRITRLPLALLSLPVLSRLDMANIDGLVCTCMENNLAPWIAHLPSYNVLGNCGEMSIHDFFSQLSPDCPTH